MISETEYTKANRRLIDGFLALGFKPVSIEEVRQEMSDHREQYQECVTQADYEFDCEGPNPEAEHEPDMTPGPG